MVLLNTFLGMPTDTFEERLFILQFGALTLFISSLVTLLVCAVVNDIINTDERSKR